jgi:CRP/FNR family transcriptional regulator, cyclic AMP receptor protein
VNPVAADHERRILMANNERVALLDARLEVTRHLSPDDRAELADVSLPVVELKPGRFDLDQLLARDRAFAATIIHGIVLHRLQIGDHAGIQLLGPGDLVLRGSELIPAWLADDEFRVSAPARLGLLGNEFLAAARRWPQIIEGLYACVADQSQRVTGQLVTCQLPRVDERVLSILWLLAESWGQVTAAGVRLPLNLTHETIGALIGARRPTVTLALRKLSEEGAILHQEPGWLLLRDPPLPATDKANVLPPEAGTASFSAWAVRAPSAPDPSIAHAELRETVQRLREQHRHDREQTLNQLKRVRTTRIRMAAVRDGITRGPVRSRRLPPSS